MNTVIRIDCMGTTSSSIDIRGMNPYTLYKQWEYAYEIVENGNEHYEPNNWTVFYTGPYGIDVKTVTIPNLLPNSVYKVMLRARQDASSPYDGSDMLVVSTDRDYSAEPLINVTLQNVSDHDATFEAGSWVSLFKNWAYSLAENPSEYDWVEFSTASARRVTFTVSNLEQVTSYKIRVRALSADASPIYDVSDPIIFSTIEETYPIGLTAEPASTTSIKLTIDPYGVTTYTQWKYVLNDGTPVNITLPGGYIPGSSFTITIGSLSAHTTYDVLVTAKDGNNVTKHSQNVLVATDSGSTSPFILTNTWLTSSMATFHISCSDSSKTLNDYDQWEYSTYDPLDFRDDSKWTSFDLSADGSFDVNTPFPSNGATRLEANTYYTLYIRAQLVDGPTRFYSDVTIFKTNVEPVSYDVNVVLRSVEPSSMSLSAVSRAEYAVVEYSVEMNPTSADWVVASATKSQYLNDFYYDFTISDLTPNTLYPVQVRCKETPSSEYVYSSILTVTTVKAPVEIYTPPVDAVVHETEVDFIRRPITKAIHIVQYDDRAPIVAVSLYKNGIPFAVPDTSDTRINIRFGKPDHTFSYNPAIGINADRTIVYFVITKQMTVFEGIYHPIVEYLVGSKIAGSGSFEIQIDRNPIQNGDIESSVEYKTVREYSQEAQHAAEMLQNVSADAVELPQHAPAYANYDPATGIFHFGLPAGGDGGVESVNGKTGVVEIDAGDIPYNPEKTIEEEIQNLEEAKANIDGYYENLGAGMADQLASTTFLEDSVPYSFRTSGGSVDVGDRLYDEIVGGTIAWNQLIQNGNFVNADGWTGNRLTVSVANNEATLTMPANVSTSSYLQKTNFTDVPIDEHKYLISAFLTPSQNTAIRFTLVGNSSANKSITANTRNFCSTILTKGTGSGGLIIYVNQNGDLAENDTVIVENVQCFDLTQMFGSAIADHIAAFETNNEGDGVSYFKHLFPKTYYEYNAGTLMSVKAASHKMIGFNAWDEVWENGSISGSTGANANNGNTSYVRSKNFIKVFPNTKYFIKSTYETHIMYYDHNKNFIGLWDANHRGTFQNQTFGVERIPPDGCGYIRFYIVASTYNNDICINLWWSGYRNGEYEAHKERVYSLDSSLELQGVSKIDSLNRVYYDGDIYKSDGTVIRRYNEVSSVDCSIGAYDAASARWYLAIPNTAPDIVPSLTTEVGKIRTSKYFTTIYRNAISASTKYCITHRDYNTAYSSRQFVFTIDPDIVSTVEEARTWVENHPFNIIYERVESVENASSFISPQWVDDFGTEEYIDYSVQQGDRDVSIPVGHNTKYLQNLRDKLQHLPDLPDPISDGDYKIRVNNYQMSLIPDGGVDGVFYDYTPTEEEASNLMTALQGYLTTGVQNAGSFVSYKLSGDFSSMTNAALTAFFSNGLMRIRFGLGNGNSAMLIPSTYGQNSPSHGVVSISIPYLGSMGGMSLTTIINSLIFSDQIVMQGTVFVS